MGNGDSFPISVNENDELFDGVKTPNAHHRRSQSLEGFSLSPQRLDKKESTFATLSVDEDGNKTINEYMMMSTLGDGVGGKVKLCMDKKTQKPFALKILSKKSILKSKNVNGQIALDAAKKEVLILKRLHHKNVVKLHEVIDDPSNNILYIVMEYVENGQVWKFGDPPIPLDKTRKYLMDILNGLDYLHKSNVVHRDIKPANLLLDHNDTVKLSDFGVSEFVLEHDDSMSLYAGTPAFQSPESLEGGTFSGKLADIWAVGVTSYLFVFGELPFNGSTHKEIWGQIQSKILVYPENIDPNLVNLLEKILEKDPTRRIKISEIRKHIWVTSGFKDMTLYDEIEKGLIREVVVEDRSNPGTPSNKPRGKSVHDAPPKIQINVDTAKRLPHHQHSTSGLTTVHPKNNDIVSKLSGSPVSPSVMSSPRKVTPRTNDFSFRAIVLTEDSTASSEDALDWWEFLDTSLPPEPKVEKEPKVTDNKTDLKAVFAKWFPNLHWGKESSSLDPKTKQEEKSPNFKKVTSPRERKGSSGQKFAVEKNTSKRPDSVSSKKGTSTGPSSPPQSEDEGCVNEHIVLKEFLKETEKPKGVVDKKSPSQLAPLSKAREIEVFNRSPSQKSLSKLENTSSESPVKKDDTYRFSMNEKIPTIPDSPLIQTLRKDSSSTLISPISTPKFSIPKKNSPRYEEGVSSGTPEAEMDIHTFFQELKESPHRHLDKTSPVLETKKKNEEPIQSPKSGGKIGKVASRIFGSNKVIPKSNNDKKE
jgi:serine/threonine protein kinase